MALMLTTTCFVSLVPILLSGSEDELVKEQLRLYFGSVHSVPMMQ